MSDGGVKALTWSNSTFNPRATVDQTAYNPHVSNGQRDRILRAAASLVGVRGGSAAHHQLVNDYNSVRPLPVGYAVKTTDNQYDIFVTTVFQLKGLSGLIGRECGVERQASRSSNAWASEWRWYHYTKSSGTSSPLTGTKIANKTMVLRITSELSKASLNGIIHTIEGNPTTKSVLIPTESDMATSVDLQPLILIKKRSHRLLFWMQISFLKIKWEILSIVLNDFYLLNYSIMTGDFTQ